MEAVNILPVGYGGPIKKDKRFHYRLRKKIESNQDTYLNDVLSQPYDDDDFDPVREEERRNNIKRKELSEERLRKVLLYCFFIIVFILIVFFNSY